MFCTISTVHRLAFRSVASASIFTPLRKGFIASDVTFFTHATAFPGFCVAFARRTTSWSSHLGMLLSRETTMFSSQQPPFSRETISQESKVDNPCQVMCRVEHLRSWMSIKYSSGAASRHRVRTGPTKCCFSTAEDIFQQLI